MREEGELKHSCDGVGKFYNETYVCLFIVVTEDEIALALTEGEEVPNPPGCLQNQLSTNGLPDAETENDPSNYNTEETK